MAKQAKQLKDHDRKLLYHNGLLSKKDIETHNSQGWERREQHNAKGRPPLVHYVQMKKMLFGNVSIEHCHRYIVDDLEDITPDPNVDGQKDKYDQLLEAYKI